VQAVGAQPQRAPDSAPLHYERHRPEQTTLYRLVQQHAANFIAQTEASTGSELPRFIKDEFDALSRNGLRQNDSGAREAWPARRERDRKMAGAGAPLGPGPSFPAREPKTFTARSGG
jgi:hypothetical protein